MSTTNNNERAEKAAGWITGLLTGWGIPGTIARIVAGAIIGALATAAALGSSGCTASFKQQTAAGSVDYSHALVLPLPIDTANDK
ncbi:MAG: hypothetical protein ACI4OS_02080 [Akkermansia sp.]